MKSSVAVVLIIAGTVLILAPYISNGIGAAQVASVMVELERNVDLSVSMPFWYDAASFLVGLLMVVTGVIVSFRQNHPHDTARAQPVSTPD